ncbi:spherulation-specific family 4 protein [Acidovorax temperans]|uniref:spherulation-specific family 4 protein n=1 Tax=Acidovorax temperans TaxID=80878 RepID=UPI0035B419F1
MSLLTLSALLTGCGGAKEDTPTTPPAPPPVQPGPLGLSFTSPVAANNVHDVGSAVSLQVSVTINGNAAPNGTPVTLTTNAISASLAPTVPTTLGGAATSVLNSSVIGPVVVNATVTSTTHSANESLKLYIRPVHQPLELLVPAYFSAAKDSPWTTLVSGAKSYPDVKITAIMNPNGGVLTSTTTANTDLATAMASFKTANGKVVAYVSTLYGNGARSEADVKATIDKYLELYPTLDGFFIDEMAPGSNRLSHYQTIYNYIKNKNIALVVIGNPGMYPDQSYANVTDVLTTFEGTAAAFQVLDPQQSSNTWVYSQYNTSQAMLAHSASTCTAMQDSLKYANKARTNAGLVFTTDETTVRAVTRLPSYWIQMLGTVDAMNKGGTLPAC